MDNLPRLIFLSGKKRSGKDTFAKQLHDNYDYQRVAFADALKDQVAEKWGLKRSDFDEDNLKEQKPPGFSYTRRQLLQHHGIERRKENPEYWTSLARDQINTLLNTGRKVVVTDARFPNELEKDDYETQNILTVRIHRPALLAVQSRDTHESETALDHFDFDLILINIENDPDALLRSFHSVLTKKEKKIF